MVMFVVMHLTKLSLEAIRRARSGRSCVALIAVLLVITYWPGLVTFVPNYFYGT